MVRRVVKISLVVALSLVVVGSVVASAAGYLGWGQSGSAGQGGTLGRVPGYLGLTNEQQQELLKIRQEHAAQALELQFELRMRMLELRQLWEADELDEEAITQRAGEVAALGVRLRAVQQALADKEKQLLTPEQMERLEKLTAGRPDAPEIGKRVGERVRAFIRSRIGRGGTGLRAVPNLRGPGRALRSRLRFD